ncbi:MAG: (2Fe-2S)-binding protein [Deltaproteobacteria bacterium CG2_30_63_29]|nr:MAG: (2Fe-2S)-binding protein [Deltaproteobacteria bacterium CG2_30_63_29]PJB34716.1 MAG: (2Fe-2S)-binding protein [Deltaproteobacteria bacterium CG_4_9_14_3_um_filter_63_12]
MKTLVSLDVNGRTYEIAVSPELTLLEALRYELGLTGSKQGCDKGDCGACTVLVDDRPTLACLTLAVAVQGRKVRTVESLAQANVLHPLQDAFDQHGAAQCGFCTPGILMSAVSLLEQGGDAPDRLSIKKALSGNLCRCTGYTKIIDAVEDVAANTSSPGPPGHTGS